MIDKIRSLQIRLNQLIENGADKNEILELSVQLDRVIDEFNDFRKSQAVGENSQFSTVEFGRNNNKTAATE